MTAKATVRVTGDGALGERPARGRLEAAAKLLEEGGFSIRRIGRFGVNIEGDEAAFARELGLNLSTAASLVAVPKPRRAGLSDLIDLVEIASAPLPLGPRDAG